MCVCMIITILDPIISCKFHIDHFSWNNDTIDNGTIMCLAQKVRETWSAAACMRQVTSKIMDVPSVRVFFFGWACCILYNVIECHTPIIPQ